MNILDTIINISNTENKQIFDDNQLESMKNKFPFLKLKKPERARIMKYFFKDEYTREEINWDFVNTCYSLPERNYQFTAIEYLKYMSDFFVADDIYRIEDLILTYSWWDTIDKLSELVGLLIVRFPKLKKNPIAGWMESDNIWLKTTSILCQINLGENTDRELLAEAINKNSELDNFFLSKSIGQALSIFSKTDPNWVENFIKNNFLSNVSRREASKFL